MCCYIYQLPSWVLDDLCRNMDTLSEWEWMQFASYVITDLTQLRKIKSMERVQGVSITRELLWWWAMRQATVRQLVDLLRSLQLYRAAQIVLNWKPVPELQSPPFLDTVKPGGPLAATVGNASLEKQELGWPLQPASSPGPGSAPDPGAQQSSPLPLWEEDTPHSLRSNRPASPDAKEPGKLGSLAGDSLLWREADVVQATDDFDPDHKISEGTFAAVYRGQRHGTPFVFKKLSEAACSSPGSVERFFQMEVQVCLRCCHPNVLPLLGFCTGTRFQGLVHPYMANGSLEDRLQGSPGSLPWPQRISICSGLLRAVQHLHGQDIIHSNVKSSNVLLDHNCTPKLAHPRAPPEPVSRRSKYTLMKTHLFQASAAYLPEDFIRVGQLTKRVDIFSCGIVLAEVLTGIPAMDNGRSPVYLKDLLLSEIPGSSTSLCSRKVGVERVMARGICSKYLERRAGQLPKDCAEALATAACLCLRRRNASLAEVCGPVDALEEQLRGMGMSPPGSRLSEATGTSSNTPEETDDVDNSSLEPAGRGPASSPHPAQDGEGGPGASRKVEATSSSDTCASPVPLQDGSEASLKIEINEAKRKLMEDILLYREEKLDSIELFGP
ncbi:von Hippel-Lindau disease tumor suppressor isoform X2 [Tenrec ecaudatus]|uniref:von Hippel-Lindau disease tumor suppressor isoform X2 n=1 Tax=Tenrec ecaudatus TaxID=94439 RepID=UPI003F5A5763